MIIFVVILVSFAGPHQADLTNGGRIIPVNPPAKPIISVLGPGDAHAGACGYCGWYSLCDNNTRWCCTQWISIGCGGGPAPSPTPAPILPPTISGTVTCDQMGQNGWCVGNDTLTLSVSDPQGYNWTIAGNAGSAALACGGNGTGTCGFPLPIGENTANYTVTSVTSGLTASGSTPYKRDFEAPMLNRTENGTQGVNGWFVSAVNISVTSSDTSSGVASDTVSVDGGPASSSAVVATDGVHTVTQTATDNAGNTRSATISIKVDTVAPQISAINTTGTSGSNPSTGSGQSGWYISPLQLSASASDATSGLASLKINVDGNWSAFSGSRTLSDGLHTVQFQAIDNAGNVTTTATQTYKVDATPPTLATALSGTQGDNGWFISTVTASATAMDAGSGIASLQYRVDGGAWQVGDTVTLDNGLHTLDFQVSDQAGNIQTASESAKVDTTPPQINFSSALSGVPLSGNVALSGVATDPVSGLNSVEVSTDNGSTWQQAASFMGGAWMLTWPTGSLSNGAYSVLLRASDNAGNKNSANDSGLILDNTPPNIGLSGWIFPNSGYVEVAPSVWPIASVEVSVNDPAGLWSDKIFLSNQSGPLTWSGRPILFPGAYPLKAKVCDAYGLCSKVEKSVLVNVSPTPQNTVQVATPTIAPSPTQGPAQPTFQRPATLIPTKVAPTPARHIIQPPCPPPSPPAAPPAETPFAPVAVGALTLLAAALLILDPRPRAWRNLTLTASQGIKKQEEDKKQ